MIYACVLFYFVKGVSIKRKPLQNIEEYDNKKGGLQICMKKRIKNKILIADDSAVNRSILSDILKNDYEIVEAENGAQTVEKIRELRAELSLVLLDIVMPETDGFEVLKIMNENRWIDEIPVIVISSDNAVSSKERAYALGVSDFISRPFNSMQVYKCVMNTIMLYIQNLQAKMDYLKRVASHDTLTGLYNHAYAKELIIKRMNERTSGKFALAIIDLDYFKSANDNFGHLFGDRVLKHTADKLRRNIRENDIAARVGGDEFLIFLKYEADLENIIKRIFKSLTGEYEGFKLSVSIGVSAVENGRINYEKLFQKADRALYKSKQTGRGKFSFYDESMKDTLSSITPIESDNT